MSFNDPTYYGAVDQFPGWPSKLQECFSQCIMSHCAADLHQRISDLLSIWPCTTYGKDWLDVLYQPIFELAQSKWWCQLSKQGYPAFPARKNIFNFARYCSPREVKVVIVGQDPYPNEHAHGLAFSVQGGEIPLSLENIFQLLERTIPGFMRNAGNLTPWAEKGVVLLNSVLTYPRGGKGCETFTNAVIKYISDYNQGVVFMLWGKKAQDKWKFINKTKQHLVLTASHPSYRSAYLSFNSCNHFEECYKYLGEPKTYWNF